MCNCELCQLHQKIKEVKASRDPDKLIAVLDEVANKFVCTVHDLDYANCVLNGSWPTAVEQLERALEAAKERRAREGSDAQHDRIASLLNKAAERLD